MTHSMRTVHVDLGPRSYPIHIGRGLVAQLRLYQPAIRGRQAMIVSNDAVAPLYLDAVETALRDYQVSSVLLPDGEPFKNLDVLTRIYDRLLDEHHERATTLIALGGGVVGDMTGFAAATYQRGVDFIQVPTTLLAQVDSSVGGKTGVNHPLGKNMIGAFYQPRCVIADLDTLDTLPDREYAAGLAEVIKYGLIADADFYGWLEANAAALQARDKAALLHAVERSCEVKAAIVREDERESGRRALLNFGHTFGHAIETATTYTGYLHGEAVAVGMLMALQMSIMLRRVEQQELGRLAALLSAFGLPTAPPQSLDAGRFLELMAHDKKVLAGEVRLVLLNAIGAAELTADYPPQVLRDLLAECCG